MVGGEEEEVEAGIRSGEETGPDDDNARVPARVKLFNRAGMSAAFQGQRPRGMLWLCLPAQLLLITRLGSW